MTGTLVQCVRCLKRYRYRWRLPVCRQHHRRRTALRCAAGTVSTVLLTASFLYMFRLELFNAFLKCGDKDSLDEINHYCQLYKQGKITGSLCQPLCDTGQVQFEQCTDLHARKQTNVMSCSDYCVQGLSVQAVLKSDHTHIKDLISQLETLPIKAAVAGQISDSIRRVLMLGFGFAPFPPDTDVLEVMWERDYARFVQTPDQVNVAYWTVMTLVNQAEYRLGKAFEGKRLMPRIYGTCGPLYLQEFCPPGLLDRPRLFINQVPSSSATWRQTATTVIKLLQLVERIEQQFSPALHLCDVKGDNFGVCADGKVLLIDADCAFFHPLFWTRFNTARCTNNALCGYLDCGGWCYTERNRCSNVVTNNNLQTICRDMLAAIFPEFLRGGYNMFSNAPASVASNLTVLLHECLAQTSTEEGVIPVYKPPMSLLNRIVRLLQNSLAEDTA